MRFVSLCASAVALIAVAASPSASAAATFTVIHTFSTGGGVIGNLVQASNQLLYAGGSDGSSGAGVLDITTSGTVGTVHSFSGSTEGSNAFVDFQGSDGNFYGVAEFGGSSNFGTAFKLTPSGAVTVLHTFTGGADGGNPVALKLNVDGNYYGLTNAGGNTSACSGQGCGTLFSLTPSGTLTTLHTFTGGADGALGPSGGRLIAASDGTLYGTTSSGGTTTSCGQPNLGCGTVFRISTAGALTTLHTFTGGADGGYPSALLVASDGTLYGTTADGGTGFGTIFSISPGGTFTTLYSFTGGADEGSPFGLVLATDGNLYGTTSGEGGTVSVGTTFQFVIASRSLTTLHTFAGSDGYSPFGLVQASDGNLYGATSGGSSSSTLFQQTLPTTASTTGGAAGGSNGGGSGGGGAFDILGLLALTAVRFARRRVGMWRWRGSLGC